MIEGSCHCAKVRIAIPAMTSAVTSCNCSICHRLGALWAYYDASQVRFLAGGGDTVAYVREGDDMGDIAFHHCPTCGVATHWSSRIASSTRMGVNVRLLDRALLDGVRIRYLDGAETWTYLE
jgi:hypothetical protein